MTRLSGHVLDTYDDTDGQVLRSMVENPSHLPPFVKTASRLTEAQINETPDDQFALILFDGSTKLKKYATVDRGNTTLSVMYLLKQAHLLPPAVVKTAAKNLIGSLEFYNLSVPDELVKAAKSGMSSVSGKTQKPYVANARIHQLQYPEILEDPKEADSNPMLGKHDAAWSDVSDRTNVEGTPGSNFLELPTFAQKEKSKTASATSMRQQSWRESPYFDVTGWDPSMAVGTESAAPERTLLDGRYAIDGYDQVKTASAYFSDNWKDLPFRDRHTYCVKLAERMDELGMAIPEQIARYGSTTYAADVDSYVEARRSYVHEESHPALDMLLEKRAQVSPNVFAEALAEFDRINDLNWHWDGKIADPWLSTFGPSIEKVANSDWRWDGVGTRISEADLKDLIINDYDRVSTNFGEDFARDFSKNPKAVFLSLPDPNKLILARLASDRFAGTTE